MMRGHGRGRLVAVPLLSVRLGAACPSGGGGRAGRPPASPPLVLVLILLRRLDQRHELRVHLGEEAAAAAAAKGWG